MIIPMLQALYDPRSMLPLPTDSAFYEQAKEDIAFFGISSQVYYLLKKRGQLDQTPLFFRTWLEQSYTEALYLNLFIERQMHQILSLFEEQGIEVIPLKGVLLAERYFGHVGARATSDIDLLIHPSDLERAVNWIKSLGFILEQERIPSHFHISYSKPLPNSPIPLTIELHWDLLKERTANLNINEFWEEARPLEPYKHIKELSSYHTFYLICLHGWRHNLDSLKYFIDMIQMIHVLQDELDYSIFLNNAASHKTLKRITRTIAIVYHYFPHLTRIKEFPVKSTRLWWEYEAVRQQNDRTLKQYVNWIYYELFDFDSMKHTLWAMVGLISR
ncbi:hypothetical protein DVH26_20485 [Paenibacillus sp. H1-7]|uniref:nucleotidyltransferase domain-containing protein n=1 Tax=Paenibacillus sp. H1-7 TaxID=2282849 RepID=UPI001EF811AE|nr:nucleotidyltransferase family protein [Paenibacillus sp. H1-7]ULL16610.1 hypothetical protein DVH26_20485 [Paenibacillus sp. H1-7]